MTQYQDLLDEAIGTPPPSRVDIDDIMARQRRRQRFLRAGGVGSAAAATVAVTLLVVTLAPQPLGDAVPGQPDRVGQPGASPPPATPPPAADPDAQRLTDELKRRMARLLPKATFAPNRPPEEKQVDALEFDDQGTHYYATAEIRDAAGVGNVYVSVGHEETKLRSDRKRACDEPEPLDVNVECQIVEVQDGLVLMLKTKTKQGNFTRYLAEILRDDGVGVSVEVDNRSIERPGEPVRGRPKPPLTQIQVYNLVLNLSLTVTR